MVQELGSHVPAGAGIQTTAGAGRLVEGQFRKGFWPFVGWRGKIFVAAVHTPISPF